MGPGFIGSHLVRRLVGSGADVHVLARPSSGRKRIADLGDAVTVWPGVIEDADAVGRCVRELQPVVVFHLAGDNDVRHGGADPAALAASVRVNLTGTLNVVAAAAATGVERLVRAGGLEEYGHGSVPFAEEQREDPVTPYSASQVAAAHYCRMLQRHVDVSILTLRLALVYGPGQSDGFFVPSLVRSALAGDDFEMTGGEQTRDFLFVDDAAVAFVAAASAPALRGEIVNVGTGVERRVRDVADTIIRLTGSTAVLRVGAAPERPVEIERLACRNEKALQLLGWSAETGLEDGLRRTIDAARAGNLV